MWSIGFDYLLECGAEGEERLALLISNFQVDNEAVALKLISRCSVEGYGDLVGDIERSLSLRFVFRICLKFTLKFLSVTYDYAFKPL